MEKFPVPILDLNKPSFNYLYSNSRLIYIFLIYNYCSLCNQRRRQVSTTFNVIYIPLNKYWLHESVTWEIVTPPKLMSNSASPRSTLVSRGWQFLMLTSRAVNIYIILPFGWRHFYDKQPSLLHMVKLCFVMVATIFYQMNFALFGQNNLSNKSNVTCT